MMNNSVVIYVPKGHDATLAERLFASTSIPVKSCSTSTELDAALTGGIGVLLLAEEMITQSLATLLTHHVTAQPAWSDLPILLLTKRGADSLEAQRAMEFLGNVSVIERPVRSMALISAVRSALRGRDRQYQMRALSERKDQFLATLAHELRNPLAPIVNATAVFERLYPTERTQKLVSMVSRQVNHLTRLIDDLMDVARITSGKLELHPSTTTAQLIVDNAVEIASGAINARGHKLTVTCLAEPVAVHADHVRLVQMLANVLVNAAKFTPESGQIGLRVATDGNQLVIAVTDNGMGLDSTSLASIFEMFSQQRSVGEPSNGLGIGLHLAKVFAEMHGGSIVARSEGRGQGSEFVLTLPVIETPVAVTTGAPAGTRPSLDDKLFLVVDDNQDAADSMQEALRLHGVNVMVAYDGATAIEMVKSKRPDVVVMDIGMPLMNGYEAARHIRCLSAAPPRLIALTGWGQNSDKLMAAEAGFEMHFVKPVDVETLLDKLEAAILTPC